MKNYLTLLMILCFFNLNVAQDFILEYEKFSENGDRILNLDFNYELRISGNESSFAPLGTMSRPSDLKDEKWKLYFADAGTSVSTYDLKNKNLSYAIDAFDITGLLINVTTIDWTITNETKKINGYQCYKAIGKISSKGFAEKEVEKIYSAWFTPSVAVQIGPTIFQGLPGLVVFGSKDTGLRKFNYSLKKIERKKSGTVEIRQLPSLTKINFEDFEEQIANLGKDIRMRKKNND